MYADKGDAAYSIMGIATRLCFQAGLHHQSSWRTYTPFEIHMRQRIFWTVYFLDRRISLSCGRPYSLREADIDIEQPAYLYDKASGVLPNHISSNNAKEIHPDQPLPDANVAQSSNVYLNCMVCWGRLAADVWDGLFAATVSKDGIANDNTLMFDARIKHWTDVVFPTIPLLQPEYPPEPRQLRQYTIVQNSLDQLRLLLFRQTLLSLQYDTETARMCGDLAIKIVQRAKAHTSDANDPLSFRHHMASSLGSAMLTLMVLLFRDMPYISLNDHSTTQLEEAYNDANTILTDLASSLGLARRIKNDFADIEAARQQAMSSAEFGFGGTVAADMKELFPYTSLDFAHQHGIGAESYVHGSHANGSSSALALNTDLWSSVFATRQGRYGVPWM